MSRARTVTTARAIALAIAVAVGLPAAARAATDVEARVSQREVREDDTLQLLVRATGDAPERAPDLSPLDADFDVLDTRQSRRIAIVNGRSELSVDWIVTLAPRKTGRLAIPALHVGAAATEPLSVEVLPAAPAGAGSAGSAASGGVASPAGAGHAAQTAPPGGSSDLFVEASVDDASPIVQGEVRYTVRVWDGVGMREGAISEPSAEGARITPRGDGRTYEATRGGRTYRVHEREFTLTPEKSGQVIVPPVTLEARVPAQRAQGGGRSALADPFDDDFFRDDPFADDLFADAFGRAGGAFGGVRGGFPSAAAMLERMMGAGGRPVRLRSNAVSLDVAAKPEEARGEWFLPARSVELQQSWSPAKPSFRVGDAVTRTIALRALGSSAEQLPAFAIPAPDGARQYAEATRDASLPTDDGTMSVREQAVSIVPTRPGRITLPAVEVRWWDVARQEMRTARLPEQTFDVAPAAGAATAAQADPAQSSAGTAASAHAAASAAATSSGKPTGLADAVRPDSSSAMDSDPPTAAAWPLSGAVALGAAAAALLAGGARIALRRRRPAAAPPPAKASAPGSPRSGGSASAHLARLRAACEARDARGARESLIDWGRATWPAAPPRSAAEIATRLGDVAAAAEIARLDAALFGRATAPWDGRALHAAIAAARVPRAGHEPTERGVLPPLYPAQPARTPVEHAPHALPARASRAA
jgi:hypothetical protein